RVVPLPAARPSHALEISSPCPSRRFDRIREARRPGRGHGAARRPLIPAGRAVPWRVADHLVLFAAADQAQVIGEAAVVQGEVIRLTEIAVDQYVVDEGQPRIPDDLALVLVLL